MTHALVLAGHGRYQDPWHDAAAIGHRLAGLLEPMGVTRRSGGPSRRARRPRRPTW